jgi:N-acetylglucosamine-6-sulfatase
LSATARTRRSVGLALAALAGLIAFALATGGPGASAQGNSEPPNIIFIQTDDQTLESFRSGVMPNTVKLIGGSGGTTFTNAVVSTPLCCPSRVATLTGQYGHNNGVLSNNPGYAGLTDRGSVLPAWLQESGYVTAHVGKWLHQFEKVQKPKTKPAPGWDEWYTALEPRAYYDYTLYVNGGKVHYGDADRDHLTDVLTRTSVKLIRKYVPRDKPLFLELDQYAPHAGPGRTKTKCLNAPVPSPGDEGLFKNEELPKPPSFNEEDISDKPSFIKDLPSLSDKQISSIEKRYRCTLASLAGVDSGVKKIWRALGQTGERDNTILVFMSDNGFFFGEHRLAKSKFRVYEEAIRVPLAIRVPPALLGGNAVGEVDQPVANIDLAPTLLELAGADPCAATGGCRVMDGRSLLDVMTGSLAGWPQDRAIEIEFKEKGVPSELSASCTFAAVRTATEIFVEHTSVPEPGGQSCRPADEGERYDLANDPYELDNQFPAQPGSPAAQAQEALEQRLDQLRTCAGIEGRDPQPAGGFYCE